MLDRFRRRRNWSLPEQTGAAGDLGGGREATGDLDRQQTAEAAAHLAGGDGVAGMVGQARIDHRGHRRRALQVAGRASALAETWRM